MTVGLRKLVSALLLSVWGVLFIFSSNLIAEDHIVGSTELHQVMVNASESRQRNLATVQEFFSTESAQKAVRKAKIDMIKVERAIPLLGDEELARLAAQTDRIQKDVAGGVLTNQQITYIIIALATAVVILIIVAA